MLMLPKSVTDVIKLLSTPEKDIDADLQPQNGKKRYALRSLAALSIQS